MTPIQMMVLSGILILITALNLKLAIRYIERKEAKRVLKRYNGLELDKEATKIPVSFSLSEIKCVDSIEKNIDTYLDTLASNEMEKIGIMKEDALVAVMIPIKVYETLCQSYCLTSHQKEQP